MGVTVYFEGSVPSTGDVGAVLAAASAYGSEHGWPEVRTEHGLRLMPHEHSEPIDLCFDGNRLEPSQVKTQFAGPDVHVKVVGLFRRLSPHFAELDVQDDAQFWDTGDRDLLATAFEQVEEMLVAALGEPNSWGPYRLPSGDIVDVATHPGAPPPGVSLIPFRPRR